MTASEAILVLGIGALFCLGIALGVVLASGVAFFYRTRQKGNSGPPVPAPGMQRNSMSQAQQQIISKMKSIYGPDLSARHQKVMEEEVEAAILGKPSPSPSRR